MKLATVVIVGALAIIDPVHLIEASVILLFVCWLISRFLVDVPPRPGKQSWKPLPHGRARYDGE